MNQQIEDRLRSALRAEAEDLRLSADPWQENQRRVLAAASGRSRRVLAVAAAALAVATLVGGVALLGGGGTGGAPASGTGDPFSTEYLLGPPVEAETLTIDGQLTAHTIALTDMTGEGPNLCDQYEEVVAEGAGSSNSSSGSGGCTPRDPAADDGGVAFDWLTGTEGSGDIRGVTAGVDSRVSKVRIWMDNGEMVLATLHPTGWDDTRMFALTTQPPDAPTAQRLVAYGRDGNVLQAVDLRATFGESWLTARTFCEGNEQGRWPFPESGGPSDVALSFGPTDALVSGSAGITPVCLDELSSAAIAGRTGFGDLVVAVLGAEAELVRVFVGSDVVAQVKPFQAQESPWRVVVLRDLTADERSRGELVVLDLHGLEIDRRSLS